MAKTAKKSNRRNTTTKTTSQPTATEPVVVPRSERRKYHWCVPCGFVVVRDEVKTGSVSDIPTLENDTALELEGLVLDFLESHGYRVADDFSTAKPYIGTPEGVQTTFRKPSPKPVTPSDVPDDETDRVSYDTDELGEMSVAELRELAESMGLSSKGNKTALVNRLAS